MNVNNIISLKIYNEKGDSMHPSFLSGRIFYLLILFLCCVISLPGQSMKINEVMSKNSSAVMDEYGDYPDWIELYNAGSSTVNMAGYALTTEQADTDPWIFPALSVPPGSHYLLFASNKDRTGVVNHWETIITAGDIWKYKAGNSSIPSTWYLPDFNDVGWTSGFSGFGFGDNDDATVVSDANSIFIRKSFNLASIEEINAAILHVDYDDGFLAYLNGVEIARSLLGVQGEEVPYDAFAWGSHEAQIYQGGKPEGWMIKDLDSLLVAGNNVLAVQVHNASATSSDLTLIPFLTLGYESVPQDAQGKPDILDVPPIFLHTDFRLSASGESLYLLDPSRLTADTVMIPALPENISYGRQPDGTGGFLMFDVPTPWAPNTTSGFTDKLPQPEFVNAGHFYSSQAYIEIAGDSTAEIYYTLDGTPPNSSSQLYTGPVQINETVVIRAISAKAGNIPSDIISETFFVDENTQLDIISIITDPVNLWDYDEGMYVMGPYAEQDYPFFGANFWQDWEKGVHLEYFSKDGTMGFEQDCGIKIYGGWSRGWDQKSLSVFARNKYGSSRFEYELFPEVEFDEYHSFILRNSGNDWNISMMRDGFLHTLVKDLNMDKQAYKPVVVMLNGAYWGIHNMREKINEEYIEQHHGVNADNIDLLQNEGEAIEGDNQDYVNLLQYIATHDLSIDENYKYVEDRIDIDNFINYYNYQIYLNNQDWPGNNIKYWKEKAEGAKWRWILFDTDFGFGIWDPNDYRDNTLAFALAENGPPWPNPAWSTFLARSLLTSDQFKVKFLNNFADLTNSTLAASRVILVLDSLVANIENEMPRQINRWNPFSLGQWNNSVNVMKNFALNRLGYLRAYYLQQFGLAAFVDVSVFNDNTEGGAIKVNSLSIDTAEWTGQYFRGVPIKLVAKPEFGYKFIEWGGDVQSSSDTLEFIPVESSNITARFVKDGSKSTIVINEINYNSSDALDTKDWVEIYNNSSGAVDLSGWSIKDENNDNVYSLINAGTVNPGEYLVICRNTVEFQSFFPDVQNIIGDFNFGLGNGGDEIRLFNAGGEMMDSVRYDDNAPWDSLADGTGRTLSLQNPKLDNNDYSNWSASGAIGGTPGKVNDNFVVSVKDENNVVSKFRLEQNYPNPFNPVTTINYSIPVAATEHAPSVHNVSLIVYDILGREVATLVNRQLAPGSYQVTFEAADLSSGIYFYTLRAGEFTDSKKMILLK